MSSLRRQGYVGTLSCVTKWAALLRALGEGGFTLQAVKGARREKTEDAGCKEGEKDPVLASGPQVQQGGQQGRARGKVGQGRAHAGTGGPGMSLLDLECSLYLPDPHVFRCLSVEQQTKANAEAALGVHWALLSGLHAL